MRVRGFFGGNEMTTTFRINAYVTSLERFARSSSGHIPGVVNPPVEPPKRRICVRAAHRDQS